MPRILDVEQCTSVARTPGAVRQARGAARTPPAGQALASGHRAAGRQHEHQRHLQAINEAADQLERLAEGSRGGRVAPTRSRCRLPPRGERAPRRDAARTRTSSASARGCRGSRQARSVRLPRARPLGRAPLRALSLLSGMGRRHRQRDLLLRRRRRCPAVGSDSVPIGVRTVPAGSLQFVDFSRPDPAADRVQRFMTAAQHALAEGNAEARRPAPGVCARRRADQPDGAAPADGGLLAGRQPAGRGRAVRDWARVDTDRPTPERFASRIYEDMGAFDLAADAAARAAERAPGDASAWARLGQLRLRLMDRDGAITALERARLLGPTVEGAARSRPRLPPRRRRRRGGIRQRGRDGDRPDSPRRVARIRARAGAHRPDQRVHRGVPPGAGAGRRPRGQPTCSSASRRSVPRGLSQRSAA